MNTTAITWSRRPVEPRSAHPFIAVEAGLPLRTGLYATGLHATGPAAGVTALDTTGRGRVAVTAAPPAQVNVGVDERTTPGVPLPAG